jgi:hypothetical protein
MCLSTPVGKGFVQGALACDLLTFLIAFGTDSQGGFLSVISTVLFLVFLYKLGLYLESQEVVSTVLGIGKAFAAGLVIMLCSAVGAMMVPMLGMFMIVGGLVSLYAGLLYVRALTQTAQALASHGYNQAGGGL